MESYSSHYFRVNSIFLKIGGLWPPADKSVITYKIYRGYQVLVFVYAVIYNSVAVIVGILQIYRDFTALIEALNIGITLLLSALKSTFWLINFKEIMRITYTLETDIFRYDRMGDFDPDLAMRKGRKIGSTVSLTFWILGQLTLAFAYIPAILTGLRYHLQGSSISNAPEFETLPYYVYVPFEYDTPLKYCAANIVQYFGIFLHANSIVGIDSLFMSMLNAIGVHMLILQDVFRSLRKRCSMKIGGRESSMDEFDDPNELEMEMMAEMKRCVRFLQMILRMCDELEEIFKYITLAQALGSTCIVCSSLLLLSTMPVLSQEFAQNFFYLAGVILQMGMFCWFGNEVTLKALDIPQALWESEWIDAKKPFKVCVLLTMMRMNKAIYLTAGKFAPLVLGTYISVLKASYSFYTMLNTTRK